MSDAKLDDAPAGRTQRARIGNTIVWSYLGLSEVFQPIVTGGPFWTAKAQQLFQFGPYGTLPEFVARLIIPGLAWLACDCAIIASANRKGQKR